MGKRSKFRRRLQKMSNGYRGQALNRHPQSEIEEDRANNSTRKQSGLAVECFRTLRSMFIPKTPTISELKFTPYSWMKMNCYINLIGDLEITGLGKIEDGVITDLKLINQSVQSALVDCTAEAMVDFMKEVGMGEVGKWTLDWHSHVNMGTSPSGTDWNNYEEMFELREEHQFPVMIVNKRQSVYCACYMGDKDVKDIKVDIPKDGFLETDLVAIYNACIEEVNTKCSKTVTTSYYTRPTYNNYSYGEGYEYSYGDSYYNNSKHEPEPDLSQGKQEKLAIDETTTKSIGQKITQLITPLKCKVCNCQLKNGVEKESGICDACYDKYEVSDTQPPTPDIKKCKSCDAELAYPEEEEQGYCYSCMEEAMDTEVEQVKNNR